MKKILSLMLILTLLMSISVNAFATTTNGTAVILRDDSNFRIVQTSAEEYKYIATYNKAKNTVLVEKFSLINGEKEVAVETDLNSNQIMMTDKNGQMSISATTLSKYTDSLYAYIKTYGTPNKWELRRQQYQGEPSQGSYYFKTNETTTNKSNLSGFMNTVNSIATLEADLEDMVGASVMISSFTTGFLIGSGGLGFGAAVAAYLVAAGFGVNAELIANQIGQKQDVAYDYYFEVFYNSNVYY